MRILITGHPSVAVHLVRRLVDQRHEVTFIHEDQAVCRAMARSVSAQVVCGDAVEQRVLDECGAGSADVVIALGDEDDRNLAICQLARLRFGVPRPLAFVNDPENEEVFRALGVESAFTPVRILASLIDQRARLGEVANVLPVAGGKVLLTEFDLPETGVAVGKSLRELALPKGALVAYVMRQEAFLIPHGETILAGGDHVLLVATPDMTSSALACLIGESGTGSHG